MTTAGTSCPDSNPEDEEEIVYIYKYIAALRIGITLVGINRLPRGYGRNDAVISTIAPSSIASASPLAVFDTITHINDVPTTSARHAVLMIRESVGSVKIQLRRCPLRVKFACAKLQRAWRKAKGISRLVCSIPPDVISHGLTFRQDLPNAAIVSEVSSSSPLAGHLEVGSQIMAIDGSCFDCPEQASQLLVERFGELVLLVKRADLVDLGRLERAAKAKAAASASSCLDCAVCLGVPKKPTEWPAMCGHHFCYDCVTKCQQRSKACPLCRAMPRSGKPAGGSRSSRRPTST